MFRDQKSEIFFCKKKIKTKVLFNCFNSKIFENAPKFKRKKNQIKLINYLSTKKINYFKFK